MAAGEFRKVDLDHARRVVIAPVLLRILWKHSWLTCDSAAFDSDKHLQGHPDLLFDGLAATKDMS